MLTARALALDLLARAGESRPRGAALFASSSPGRRAAQKALAGAFGDFVDGWAPLAAAARDLVDAGLRARAPGAVGGADRSRGCASAARDARPCARSARGAGLETLAALEARGLAPDAELYVRAAERLRRGTARSEIAPACFLHGFSDATGVIADLIEALARAAERDRAARRTGRSRGAGERGPAIGWGFGARLRERLDGAIGRGDAARGHRRGFTPLRAGRAVAGARGARGGRRRAARARRRRAPGRIGLVVRDPALLPRGAPPRARAPGRAVQRFGGGRPDRSGRATGRPRSCGRSRSGADTPVDLGWSSSWVRTTSPSAARCGSRCGRWAASGSPRSPRCAPPISSRYRAEGYPLPARAGMAARDDGPDGAEPEARPLVRRRLAVEPIEALLRRAPPIRDSASSGGPWRRTGAEHRAALAAWLGGSGLARSSAGRRLLDAAARLDAELPARLALARDVAIELLRGRGRRGREPCRRQRRRRPAADRGRGARQELRSPLRPRSRARQLPAPRRRRSRSCPTGFVCASATCSPTCRSRPRVTKRSASCSRSSQAPLRTSSSRARPTTTRGRPLPASPLLEALRRDGALDEFVSARSGARAAARPRGAAGLVGGVPALAELLPAALEEGRRRFGATGAQRDHAAGRARCGVLVEFETDPAEASGRERIRTSGRTSGSLGRSTVGAESAATTLEAQAACAWQAFLERTLRLEPIPDPLARCPRWTGGGSARRSTRCCGRLFGGAGDGERSLERALAAPGSPLLWPDPRGSASWRGPRRGRRCERQVEPEKGWSGS